MITILNSNFKQQKGYGARIRMPSGRQIVFSDITTAFFSASSCVLVLDSAGRAAGAGVGAGASDVVTLLQGRLTHT